MPLSSEIVAARHRALLERSPTLPVVTDLQGVDAARVDAIFGFKLPAGVASALPGLKLVASVGAGADGLLAAGDIPPGVPVTRVVDRALGLSMAQYVSYHVMRRFRRFDQLQAQQAAGVWQRQPIPDASQHTVAILGLGAIGREVAAVLGALGFRVTGWSRRGQAVPGVATVHAGAAGLPACLAEADVAVCLLPFTPQTRGLLNAQVLRHAKPGALLLNAARGGIVVEADLLRLLDEGPLGAAVLDVFETEPLPAGHPLWAHPRVTLTPHIAAQPSVEAAISQFLDNLQRVRAGHPALHAIDRASGY